MYDFLGLTQNEQIVYEAFLKYGENVASHIAEVLKMDKSSVYNATESLVKKRLLVINKRKRSSTYLATTPDVLKKIVVEKEREVLDKKSKFDSFVKDIKARALQIPHASYIKVEYGYEAHERSMRKTLESKDKLIRMKTNAQSPIFDDPRHVDFMKKYYFKERIARGIFLHQLFQYQESYPLDEMNITDPSKLKEMRILPYTFQTFDSFKIVDDLIIITVFEPGKDVAVITIEDSGIAKMMREMFDFVWQHSVVYYGKSVLESSKLKSGNVVSKIGMGTRGIGAWDSPGKVYTYKNPYFEESFTSEALGYFLSHGVNYIDLCLKYANGKSVETVEKLLRNYPRRNLYILGKFTKLEDKVVTDLKDIEKQCDRYLKILNTDYLDYFQIHSPRIMQFSVADAVVEIEKLIDKGKVRHLSVSNFGIKDLEEALAVSRYGIETNEIPYNLFEREYELDGTIDFCISKGIGLIFIRALGLGRLCGLEEDLDAPELFKYLMHKYKKTSSQIALNWVLKKYPENSFVIVKSENPAHISENIAALDFKLEKVDVKKLDEFSDYGDLRLKSVRLK